MPHRHELDPEPDKPAILPVRVVQAFTSPGELFESLARRPVWLDALALILAVTVIATWLVPEEITRRVMEQFLPPGTDPAQVDRMIEGGRVRGLIGVLLGIPFAVVLTSGLLLLAYNVFLGGEGTFRQLVSATTHAYFIVAIGGLLTLGLMFLGSEEPILSPAVLLPDLGDGFLGRWLGLINVFAVWMCGLLGVAVSRIYPKRSVAGAMIYLLVLYLGWSAVSAAFLGLALSASG